MPHVKRLQQLFAFRTEIKVGDFKILLLREGYQYQQSMYIDRRTGWITNWRFRKLAHISWPTHELRECFKLHSLEGVDFSRNDKRAIHKRLVEINRPKKKKQKI